MASAAAGSPSSPPSSSSRVVLATGGYDHTVRIWDASSGVCYKSFLHADKQVNSLCVTADKNHVAAGGNPLIRWYDVNAKGAEPLLSFSGHASNVMAVGVERTARFLFSCSEDGSIRIWDPRAGVASVREYDARRAVNSVVLHPNQGELISGDHSGAVRVWDLVANKCSSELVPEGDTPVSSVSIAADASLVAASTYNGSCFFWAPPTEGGRDYVPVKKLRAHRAYITACCLSPDAHYFATTSSDRTMRLWNTHDFSLAATLTGHARWVWDAAFSADSSYVVTASSDMTAKLWHISSTAVVRTYAGHVKGVTAVALNDAMT